MYRVTRNRLAGELKGSGRAKNRIVRRCFSWECKAIRMRMENIDETFFLKVSVPCEWVMVIDCEAQVPAGV